MLQELGNQENDDTMITFNVSWVAKYRDKSEAMAISQSPPAGVRSKGIAQNGNGWTPVFEFRGKTGKMLVERDRGVAVGVLTEDGERVFFK